VWLVSHRKRRCRNKLGVYEACTFNMLELSPTDLISQHRNCRQVTDLKEVNERAGAEGRGAEEMIVGSD